MRGETEVLSKYLPEKAIDLVFQTIVSGNIQLRISRVRKSKLGDFRPAANGGPHRVSVNRDLNPFHFLIVFVHELAHVVVHERYGRGVQAHGQQWKMAFREQMKPYFELGVFPKDIELSLSQYLKNAKAINGTDLQLAKVLARYDTRVVSGTDLEILPAGSLFKIPSGRVFRKLDKQRKRYKCQCVASGRLYLFNPIAKVEAVNAND
jgi:SprT protein